MKKKGFVLFICTLVLLFGVGTVTALSEGRFSWKTEAFTTTSYYVDENGNLYLVTEPPENPEDITDPDISVPTTAAPPTQPAAQAQAVQPTIPETQPTLPEALQNTPENIARYAENVEHNIQVFLEKQHFSRNNLDTKIEDNDLDPDSPPIKEKLEELNILESEGKALLANYQAGLLSDEEAGEQLMNLYFKDWGLLDLK